MLFTGEYEYTIDSKQRLAIPAEIRSRMSPEIHGEAFYIVPGANGSLWLWPERTFERMTSAIENSLLPGEEMMEFEELMFPQSKLLDIDKAGRIRIPDQLLREYGLGDTVTILGMKDHLELRDPQQWKSQRQDSITKRKEIMVRARLALRKEVDGGKNDRP